MSSLLKNVWIVGAPVEALEEKGFLLREVIPILRDTSYWREIAHRK